MRTGRPQKVSDDELLHYVGSVEEPTTADVAAYFGVDRSTAYVRLVALDRVERFTAEFGRQRWLLTP